MIFNYLGDFCNHLCMSFQSWPLQLHVTGFFHGGVFSPAPTKGQFLHSLFVLESHLIPPDGAQFLIKLLYWIER